MSTGIVNQTATVILDGSGNGYCQLGPLSARETWTLSSVHVICSSATNEAVCRIYIGNGVFDSNFIDGTFTGSSGDASSVMDGMTVSVGDAVYAAWTGGDAGATATLSVVGTSVV